MLNTMKRLNEEYNLGMPPSAFIKKEIIVKQGKAPRIIINEGPERCVNNLLMIYIIENVIFEQVASDMCIKHADKRVVFDRICKRFSRRANRNGKSMAPAAFIGIDQSSFDMSEQFVDHDGLLSAEMMILNRILKVLAPDECDWTLNAITERERDTKFQFTVTLCKGFLAQFRARLKGRRRHSGDRGTSVLNWIVEFLATLSSVYRHPEMIVEDVANGTVWKRTYGTVVDGINSGFWGVFEGDDGLIRVIMSLLKHLNVIEENYHKLGLDCTLEGAGMGRAVVEVVGLHLMIEDGYTIYENEVGAFCSMVNRSLAKSGWSFSRQPIADAAASYYRSRALEYSGKVRFIYDIYDQLAEWWTKQGGRIVQESEDFDVYKHSGEESASWLPLERQLQLLQLSTGSASALGGEYGSFAGRINGKSQSGDFIDLMPPGFQDYVMKLSGNVPPVAPEREAGTNCAEVTQPPKGDDELENKRKAAHAYVDVWFPDLNVTQEDVAEGQRRVQTLQDERNKFLEKLPCQQRKPRHRQRAHGPVHIDATEAETETKS